MEMMVVLVIMAVAGAMVIPLVVDSGGMQALSAARMLASDLQYAQNVAMTSQRAVTVTFDPSGDSYTVSNASGPLIHPMTNSAYVVDYHAQSGFDRVDIVSANFAGGQAVTFDELGSPDNAGSVTIRGGPDVYRVDVAAVTGTVTVTKTGP